MESAVGNGFEPLAIGGAAGVVDRCLIFICLCRSKGSPNLALTIKGAVFDGI